MLRLPRFRVERPTTAAEAVRLAAEFGPGRAMYLAGGTDLVPNLKHRLFEPEVVVALDRVDELRGIRHDEDATLVGAMTSLTAVAEDAELSQRFPALAQAAGVVSGPQLRNMGTLGGNLMLDTRCRWYNQSHFWRQALGYCLKKDGTVCHVVAGGSKCVAAASNDTAPALMTLDAEAVFLGTEGERTVPVAELWQADGVWNKKVAPTELLTAIRIPRTAPGHRGAYGKLRERGSIDFPLFGVAVRLDLDGDVVAAAAVAAVGLQARPIFVRKADEPLLGIRIGTAEFENAARESARRAHKQCIPMPNVPGDADYRREMVPVFTRRTLLAAASAGGPVLAR